MRVFLLGYSHQSCFQTHQRSQGCLRVGVVALSLLIDCASPHWVDEVEGVGQVMDVKEYVEGSAFVVATKWGSITET